MARDNIQEAVQIALQAGVLEKLKEDGIERIEATGAELEAQLQPYMDSVIDQYGEALGSFLLPWAYTLVAESLTATELREAGIAEDMIQRFDTADTAERESLLEQLEPIAILALFIKKAKLIKAKLKEYKEVERIAGDQIAETLRTRRIKQAMLQRATPDIVQGIQGLLKADKGILEQAVKREAKETTDANTIYIGYKIAGEYPDGTPWEREATPEEQAELEAWSQ